MVDPERWQRLGEQAFAALEEVLGDPTADPQARVAAAACVIQVCVAALALPPRPASPGLEN